MASASGASSSTDASATSTAADSGEASRRFLAFGFDPHRLGLGRLQPAEVPIGEPIRLDHVGGVVRRDCRPWRLCDLRLGPVASSVGVGSSMTSVGSPGLCLDDRLARGAWLTRPPVVPRCGGVSVTGGSASDSGSAEARARDSAGASASAEGSARGTHRCRAAGRQRGGRLLGAGQLRERRIVGAGQGGREAGCRGPAAAGTSAWRLWCTIGLRLGLRLDCIRFDGCCSTWLPARRGVDASTTSASPAASAPRWASIAGASTAAATSGPSVGRLSRHKVIGQRFDGGPSAGGGSVIGSSSAIRASAMAASSIRSIIGSAAGSSSPATISAASAASWARRSSTDASASKPAAPCLLPGPSSGISHATVEAGGVLGRRRSTRASSSSTRAAQAGDLAARLAQGQQRLPVALGQVTELGQQLAEGAQLARSAVAVAFGPVDSAPRSKPPVKAPPTTVRSLAGGRRSCRPDLPAHPPARRAQAAPTRAVPGCQGRLRRP